MLSHIEDCIPALRRYAFALLRDRQDADDLVRDCLVRALDKLHTHRDDVDLRSWLFTIMHNVFVNQRRRAKARPDAEALKEDEEEGAHGMSGNQEDHIRLKESLRVLNRLPEDQRAVVFLVCVEDLSYAEVAQVLGVPVGTVMSRLARGREGMRQAAQERGRPALRRVK
jgi:RNA polymerase sigma-70 factor (ECF subfamily)